MIAKPDDLERKLAGLGLSLRRLARAKMLPRTLEKKVRGAQCNFTLAEAQYLANLTGLSEEDFLRIFFKT